MSEEARFGPYRVAEPLGSGAIATIYRAVHEPLGRIVAIKALKAQISPTSSFGAQLDREAKILRDLAHPNIVLILDAGRTDAGRPYVALEHIEGPSLQQLLAKKRTLSVESALAIAMSLCAALEHAHSRGVVHRDVKPGNVLLSRGGIVKLIDFGIAQRARTASVSDAFGAEGITPSGRMAPEPLEDAFGTPAYMSPEQILGDFVDGRSDLFSLGVVLYQMLAGSRPFEPASREDAGRSPPPLASGDRSAAQRIRRDVPAPLRERAHAVPRSVERVVMRLLEKSRDERYANATLVLERLHRELRALTRDDPAVFVNAALVDAGYVPAPSKSEGIRLESHGVISPLRAAWGYALIFALFAVGVVAIEGSPLARTSASLTTEVAADAPAGALRVVATPWAHVSVDGKRVETTPFARPIPLSLGKHWVTLTHPDATPVEREITVAPNEVVALDVTMVLSGAPVEDAGRDAK